jgi:hypothetical protein
MLNICHWYGKMPHENARFEFWGDDAPASLAEPNSAQDYRERATRLRAIATDSPDPQTRAYLLTTAAEFDRLADYAAASAATTHAA